MVALVTSSAPLAIATSGIAPHRTDTLPDGLPPFIKGKHFTKERLVFGEFLFSSQLLSSKSGVSCASCHSPILSTSQEQSKIRLINSANYRESPPIYNLTYSQRLMWDGASPSIDNQPRLPLESENEMNINWSESLENVSRTIEGKQYLSGRDIDSIYKHEVLISLSVYLRSMVAGNSRFDKYMYRGENTLSQNEIDGFNVFKGKAKCSSCHSVDENSATFTDNGFHVLGVGYANGAFKDNGRYGVTGNYLDKGAFKTPTLRNIQYTSPYMHDGSLSTLEAVIEFYDKGGISSPPNLDSKMEQLNLTETEKTNLVLFLKTLNSSVYSYHPFNK
ncbi:MAG: c-type cytochrome [Gammaproteobacteria bacterium]|nr:c-type cytochrome [Gammaproteobacteria bacterium]